MRCIFLILVASSLFAEPQPSKGYTQIAKKATPATVFIKAQMQQNNQSMQFSDPFQDEFFRKFFGGQQQQQPQVGGGSGFIVRPDGYIVTNCHVIKEATLLTVILNDGREYTATVKGSDPRTDLAVLKIEEKELPYLPFGDSDVLEVGELVVAIGNPFGLEASLSAGVVSAKGRQDLGIASFEDFIQTDAAINPGNSGGPLLNLQSEVIGVNTAIMTRSGGYMGIGLAIPSKMAQNVIDQIIDGGAVKRGYLGIVLQPLDKDLAEALSLEKQEGILISEVTKNSAAEKGGLLQGDVIIAYNNKPVKNVSKFRNDIALMSPDTEISLRVLRNNKPMNLTFLLGSLSEKEAFAAEATSKMGLELENLTSELTKKLGHSEEASGVIISKVQPGSPAAIAGLRPGFLITGVAVNWSNQKRIHNTAEFDEAMKELGDKRHLILIVRHQNFQRYYTLKMG